MRHPVRQQGAARPRVGGRPPKLQVWPALAVMLLWLVTSCRRDEISHFRVPKGPTAAFAGSAGSAELASPQGAPVGGDLPAPPAPAGAGALKWTLPKGWTESLAGGMRYATLKPSVAGRVDVSVVVLPGPAGGELANVNRWRGQIGLPPIDESTLASARKLIQTKAGAVSVYDFSSEGDKKSRLVAGLTAAGGNTWFVKMMGDADPVGAARPDFIRLLESLRLED